MANPETNPATTFAKFTPGEDLVSNLGVVPDHQTGVIAEIKLAFGVKSDSMADLIREVAPHKELQDNIAHARKVLSDAGVQASVGYADPENAAMWERLGYDAEDTRDRVITPAVIAADWAMRAGLQDPVFRPLMRPARQGEHAPRFDVGVMPDRVGRWVDRMAVISTEVAEHPGISTMVLASGSHKMSEGELADVSAGTPVNRYMATEVLPRLGKTGLFGDLELVSSKKADGNAVLDTAVKHIGDEHDLDTIKVVVPAVAGNWMQTGAQVRGAFKSANGTFDVDPEHPQLWVASDRFPIDPTGQLPPSEAQNPLSAIGNVLRGAKLLSELRQ